MINVTKKNRVSKCRRIVVPVLCASLWCQIGYAGAAKPFSAQSTTRPPAAQPQPSNPAPQPSETPKSDSSLFGKLGSRIKKTFTPGQNETSTASGNSSNAGQPATKTTAPSQVTRNNPLRPGNTSTAAIPSEPNKFPAGNSEVMKHLEELYKQDGRIMPDMGPLRDSHAAVAAELPKVQPSQTVRPSELSDSPLGQIRKFIPGMDRPIETVKIDTEKELPAILPETRVTAEDVKIALPMPKGPAIIPDAPQSSTTVVSKPNKPSVNSASAQASAAPQVAGPTSTLKPQHPLTVKQSSSAPVNSQVGLFPDAGQTRTTPSQPEIVKQQTPPKMNVTTPTEEPLFVLDVKKPIVSTTSDQPSQAQEAESGQFIMITESQTTTPPSSTPEPKATLVEDDLATFFPDDIAATTPVNHQTKPQNVATTETKTQSTPSQQDVSIEVKTVSSNINDNPFAFPAGGLKEADQVIDQTLKADEKVEQTLSSDKAPGVTAEEKSIAETPSTSLPATTVSETRLNPIGMPESPFPEDELEKPTEATTQTDNKVVVIPPLPETTEEQPASPLSETVIDAKPSSDVIGSDEEFFQQPEINSQELTQKIPAPEMSEASTQASDFPTQSIPTIDESPSLPTVEPAQPELKLSAPANAPRDRTPEEKYELIASRAGMTGFKGFGPVALRDQRKLIDTDPEYQVLYQEKLYYFSSAAMRDAFVADPERYLPARGGYDVVILKEAGFDDEGMLDFAVWYHGKLYLFASKNTMLKFSDKPSEYAIPD